MWIKCRNYVCRLTIVFIIMISLCYYYFSPIAHRTKNYVFFFFLVYFISLENISCGYYYYYNNKGNINKIITVIVIIIISGVDKAAYCVCTRKFSASTLENLS